MKTKILILLSFMLSFFSAFAETIVLKSGKTIEATILERTNESIKIDVAGIPVTYYLEDIQSIGNEKIGLPADIPTDILTGIPAGISAELPGLAQNPPLIKDKKDFSYTKRGIPGPFHKTYNLHNEKGLKCLENNDYQCAISEFETAIKLIPTESVCYINLGLTYKKMGNHQEAIKFLEKAISCDPEDSEIYYNLGNVYFELLRDKEAAMRYYLKAIEKDQSNAKAYLHLGVVYLELGQYASGKENIEKAKKIFEQRGDTNGAYFAEQNLKTIPR
ncbi:MAG: tetratricopeptide repeat protein [Candidatus Omnitrophota bacterium]|nr:tetratricopeptide repeat protein [Candidatus Omnitrophota bacterium]